MNLRFAIILCMCWHTVWAENPIILLKEGTENFSMPELNDTPKSTENSSNNDVKTPTKAQADSIDAYTSGLTPQFRTLLLAPDSREPQQPRKSIKEQQKETDEKSENVYPVYKNEYEDLGLPQAHIDQLLRYYGKIAGKLLPQGYAKFRKIITENEKSGDNKQEEPETKETPTGVETPTQEVKILPVAEHVVNTAVNAAIANAALAALQGASSASLPGYGTLNYLNAANYPPPTPQNAYTAAALRNRLYASNYLTNQNTYGLPAGGCCNYCPPCNTQPVYENNCGGGLSNANSLNSVNQGLGCAGTEYTNADTDNDDYGPDNYFQGAGGYGTSLSSREAKSGGQHTQNTQLLSGYAPQPSSSSSTNPSLYGSSKQPYYQVSSPISSPFLVDAHPYSPVGSMFATSHMHHFGPYSASTSPFQQYYGTVNAYPSAQRYNYGSSMGESELSHYGGYSTGPFGPMFDYSPSTSSSSSNLEPESTTIVGESKDPIENIFHIVKPNFSSLKKVAIMKKHRISNFPKATTTTLPLTTILVTKTPTTTIAPKTKSSSVGRKLSKMLTARKPSTPTPKTTTLKVSKKVINETNTKTTQSSTTQPSTTTAKIVTSTKSINSTTKKIRFS